MRIDRHKILCGCGHSTIPFHSILPFHSTIPFHRSIPLNKDTLCVVYISMCVYVCICVHVCVYVYVYVCACITVCCGPTPSATFLLYLQSWCVHIPNIATSLLYHLSMVFYHYKNSCFMRDSDSEYLCVWHTVTYSECYIFWLIISILYSIFTLPES